MWEVSDMYDNDENNTQEAIPTTPTNELPADLTTMPSPEIIYETFTQRAPKTPSGNKSD